MHVAIVVEEPDVPAVFGYAEIPPDCDVEGNPDRACISTRLSGAAQVQLEGVELGPNRLDITVFGHELNCSQPPIALDGLPPGCALLTVEFSGSHQGRTLLRVFDERKRLWAAFLEDPSPELRIVGQRLD